MRRTFGWSLPPGCGRLSGEEPEPPCAVCAKAVECCVCPECPECGATGELACYGVGSGCGPKPHAHGGMMLTREQVVGRQEARVHQAMMSLQNAQEILGMLRTGEFSPDIADSPDPWR